MLIMVRKTWASIAGQGAGQQTPCSLAGTKGLRKSQHRSVDVQAGPRLRGTENNMTNYWG